MATHPATSPANRSGGGVSPPKDSPSVRWSITTGRRTTFFTCSRLVSLSHLESPWGNSGTQEPVLDPDVPRFPKPPVFGGHNSQKHGNRAGIIDPSPGEWGRSQLALLQRPKRRGNGVEEVAEAGGRVKIRVPAAVSEAAGQCPP